MSYINILRLSIFRIACVRATSKVMVSLMLVAVALALANPVMAGGNKVDVCHIPPGNPDNKHTITISNKALDAHLAHGDLAGSCENQVTCPCWDGGEDSVATSLQAFWTDNTPLPCTYDACVAETSTNGTSTTTEHDAGCDAPTNFPVGTLNQRWTESIVTMVITDTIEERSCETWVCYCEEDPSAKHDGCCISPKIELTLDQYEACAADHESFTHMTVGAKPNVVEPCGLPTPGE